MLLTVHSLPLFSVPNLMLDSNGIKCENLHELSEEMENTRNLSSNLLISIIFFVDKLFMSISAWQKP